MNPFDTPRQRDLDGLIESEYSDTLPPEITDLIDQMREHKNQRVEAIGKYVAKKRDEAVKGRRESGIESVWDEDEEYYLGIDDANRESHPWLKSASTQGGISRTPSKSTTRCTEFFNITRPFVESASARMGDILLPAGDWNFGMKATPVQDLELQPPMATQPPVQPAMQPPMPTQQAPGQPPGQPPQQPPADPLADAQKLAEEACKKAEQWIRDKLVECSYHTEVRKVIEDSAKLGTGVLKGPVPKKLTSKRVLQSPEGVALDIVIATNPASTAIDPWDCFPDPQCGEDIHDGSYFIERDRMTARQLKDLKGLPGYLSDQIDKVLDEGPSKKNYSDGYRSNEDTTQDDDKFEVWYYYGLVDADALDAMDVSVTEEDCTKNMLPAVVTLVNETPIRAFINPLDTGEFPYDFMVWQRQPGSPWGIGVARQGRTAQKQLNAAARALMDNAGLSSGPQLVIRQGAIRPADGKWEITARKVWIATEQADIRSVSDAILAINIPMVQAELQNIIQLAQKMMEDATGITYLMQGQQGAAPDTVGGMEMLHRNASANLRRLARVFDERVTEPHIRRYYDWLLMYGPDDCKGDFEIDAYGSTALVEREIQDMQTLQILQLAVNPVYGLDPEKAMAEFLRSKRMIPEKFQLDETKKQQMSQKQPTIPAIEVAKIRAAVDEKKIQSEEKKAQAHLDKDAEKIKVDMDRDLLYARTMAMRDKTTQSIRMEELKMKRETVLAEREIKLLDYANRRNISLDQIKADLAAESMRLRTQKELAQLSRRMKTTPQVARTTMEPVGHAEDGRAFEQ